MSATARQPDSRSPLVREDSRRRRIRPSACPFESRGHPRGSFASRGTREPRGERLACKQQQGIVTKRRRPKGRQKKPPPAPNGARSVLPISPSHILQAAKSGSSGGS